MTQSNHSALPHRSIYERLNPTPEVIAALTIVQQAARLARHIQAEMISPALSKEDRSPVTVADFAIQALVARSLSQAFPADPLVAEEDSSNLRDTTLVSSGPLLDQVTAFVSDLAPEATPQSVCEWIDRGRGAVAYTDRYWLLDPIDGTKGFLRGGQYAVALALMAAGQVQIGALGCPALSLTASVPEGLEAEAGTVVIAVRGQGTWASTLEAAGKNHLAGKDHQWERLRVSGRGDPAQARLLRSFEAGHTNVEQIDQFADLLGIRTEPVLMDSQVKYAVLAAGQGDLMLRLLSAEKPDYREKAWDQAAGSLVVEEAGGRASDLHGKAFDFTAGRELIRNRGVLVSNGLLHEAALQALRAVGA